MRQRENRNLLTRLFIFFLIAGLTHAPSAHAAVPEKVQLEVEVRGELLKLDVKNVSSDAITVQDFIVDDGKQSGYCVYLYDQSTKHLIHPSASYQLPPSQQSEVPQEFKLRTGQVKTFSEPVADILKFFGASSRCNWLVIVYVKRERAGPVRSSPSSPALLCSEMSDRADR